MCRGAFCSSGHGQGICKCLDHEAYLSVVFSSLHARELHANNKV